MVTGHFKYSEISGHKFKLYTGIILTLCTLNFALCTFHFVLYTIHFILCTIHLLLYTIKTDQLYSTLTHIFIHTNQKVWWIEQHLLSNIWSLALFYSAFHTHDHPLVGRHIHCNSLFRNMHVRKLTAVLLQIVKIHFAMLSIDDCFNTTTEGLCIRRDFDRFTVWSAVGYR